MCKWLFADEYCDTILHKLTFLMVSKWRLVSTREPTIVHLPKSIDKVTILDKKDEVLGCHMMSIEFKDGESPIDGKKKYVSCFALISLVLHYYYLDVL